MPELPEGWTWASVEQLTLLITSGSRGWAKFYASSGVLFIRSQDISTDKLDLLEVAKVQLPAEIEGARTLVERDDVLLTITGANVGKCAHVTIDLEETYVSQHVALIRPVDRSLGAYLHLYLTSLTGGRKQLLDVAYGAGKPGLNLQQVASVILPLPLEVEINKIVAEVNLALAAIDEQERAIELSLKQAEAQRKNILKAAFSGHLVPQNPNDEPASLLLERIKAAQVKTERSARQISKKQVMKKKMQSSEPTALVETLRVAEKELSSSELMLAAGYPSDAEAEIVEQFFVAVRDAIIDKKITKERRNDQDWFAAAN